MGPVLTKSLRADPAVPYEKILKEAPHGRLLEIRQYRVDLCDTLPYLCILLLHALVALPGAILSGTQGGCLLCAYQEYHKAYSVALAFGTSGAGQTKHHRLRAHR